MTAKEIWKNKAKPLSQVCLQSARTRNFFQIRVTVPIRYFGLCRISTVERPLQYSIEPRSMDDRPPIGTVSRFRSDRGNFCYRGELSAAVIMWLSRFCLCADGVLCWTTLHNPREVPLTSAKGNSPAAAGFFTHFFFRRKEPGGEPYKTPNAFP